MTVLTGQGLEIIVDDDVPCNNCSDNIKRECAVPVDDVFLCYNCVRICEDCSIEFHPESSPYSEYCEECAESYFTCENCDRVTYDDYATTVDDSTWCEHCTVHYASWCDTCDTHHAGDPCGSGLIEPYSYKPEPIFYSYDNHTGSEDPEIGIPYFGVELEVECPNNVGEVAQHFVPAIDDNLLYLKHDGSLNNGFEIVTHPMTHGFFTEHFPWGSIAGARYAGARSWDARTCGLHVHIGRAAFDGMAHMYRFSHLIHDNEVFVSVIAGRSSQRWASFDPDNRAAIKEYVKEPWRRRSVIYNRYVAVNFQNTETIEVRVFRGSLRKERILSAVDFMDAAFWYTAKLPYAEVVEHKLSHVRFMEWLRERRDLYPSINTIFDETLARNPRAFNYDD